MSAQTHVSLRSGPAISHPERSSHFRLKLISRQVFKRFPKQSYPSVKLQLAVATGRCGRRMHQATSYLQLATQAK